MCSRDKLMDRGPALCWILLFPKFGKTPRHIRALNRWAQGLVPGPRCSWLGHCSAMVSLWPQQCVGEGALTHLAEEETGPVR